MTTENILIAKLADDQARLNLSQTNHLNMIKYLRKLNSNLIENLVHDTVRTRDYQIENDQSDQDDYIERNLEPINQTLYDICLKQLKNPFHPMIIYSNYRKLFNKTLTKVYKQQVGLLKINFFIISD